MKIRQFNTSSVESWEDLRRFASTALNDIYDLVNGRLSLIDNVQSSILTISFNAANTSQAFTHTLKTIPTGYLLVKSPLDVRIYDGTGTNTADTIYLKATSIATVKVLIF